MTFANATITAFFLLRNSTFNFHCYTQREAMPTQKSARKRRCDLSRLLARKITKGIRSCKSALPNRPILILLLLLLLTLMMMMILYYYYHYCCCCFYYYYYYYYYYYCYYYYLQKIDRVYYNHSSSSSLSLTASHTKMPLYICREALFNTCYTYTKDDIISSTFSFLQPQQLIH